MKKISNKNKKNKKGFTLIELLAVIIVLAMIMVFAIPSILNISNDAQKRTFQLTAERILNAAATYIESQRMLGSAPTTKTAYATSDLELGSYAGYGTCIEYNPSSDGKYTLTLYISNGNFCYQGKKHEEITGTDPVTTNCPAITVYKPNSGKTACTTS